MGKLATMIVLGGLKHGIALLAFMLLVQTGCLYLTTVYADFEIDAGRVSHRGEDLVTGFYGEEDDEGDDDLWGFSPDGEAVIVQDFVEMSSAKVMMKVKESEDGLSLERVFGESGVNPEKLKRLEKRFLDLFGMESRPKRKLAGGKRQVPKELIELYEKQNGVEIPTTDLLLPGKLTRNANTVRVVNPFEITSLDQSLDNLHALLKFDLSPSSIPPNEQITGAELRVPFAITVPSSPVSNFPNPSSVFARVLLHDVIKPQSRRRLTPSSLLRNTPSPITHVIDSKLVNLTNRKSPSFWLTFDILPAVLRWMTGNGNHTNYGVALQLVGLLGEPYHDIKHSNIFNLHLNPSLDKSSLFLYSDDGHNPKHHRNKRDTSPRTPAKNNKSSQRKLRRAAHHQYQQQQQYYRNHNQYSHYANSAGRRRKPHRHKNKRRNLCSKKPMFVDFTDVGWNDWIVAPPGYQAYYCSGECPFPMGEHLNATNHAVIQALINSMNPSLVPPPCCVPNKYSSLSLLYTDSSDRIVLKNYNEMVVDSCGCS